MAKKKSKKRKNKSMNYDVGYCKPPKEYQWVKGCESPNPKGRPKKITNIREALQISLGKEITAKDEKGETCKITCAEALARKTVADAISKDGPTRRLFYRNDMLHLATKEQEYEYKPSYAAIKEVEEEYGHLLREIASIPKEKRKYYFRMYTEMLQDIVNERCMNENCNP